MLLQKSLLKPKNRLPKNQPKKKRLMKSQLKK